MRHVITHAKIDRAIDELDALDWVGIAASLSRPQYSKLKRFVVCISIAYMEYQPSEEETKNWIMERLPALVNQEIIQIQFHIMFPAEEYPADDDSWNSHWSARVTGLTGWDEEL